jgi:hypothetical protein
MMSQPDGNSPSSAGGLIATGVQARLAIFCQSFVETSPRTAWQRRPARLFALLASAASMS